MRSTLLLLLATGCPKAPTDTAWITASWLGRWEHDQDALSFVRAGESTVGVLFPAAPTFEVWIVAADPPGRLTLVGPTGPHVDLPAKGPGQWAQGPDALAISGDGDALAVLRPDTHSRWVRAAPVRAPEAEAADLAFAADAAVRGAAAWADAFLPDGATWSHTSDRTLGGEAIARDLAPLYARPGLSFAWEPVDSGLSLDGGRAWTLGTYRLELPGDPPETGHYLTIWSKVDPGDGTPGAWKILFDTGFPDP